MRASYLKVSLASIQWFFFIFTNTIVVPISIGTTFGLPHAEIAGMLQVSLIFTGIACLLQGWIGHKYPLMEGHSGLMWGLILNLSMSASSLGMSFTQVGGGIATGVMFAGITLLFCSVFNLVPLLKKIFTPMVMTVFLFLLSFQLMTIFFQGMLKFSSDGSIVISISLFSFFIVFLVSVIKIKGSELLGNFSVLIGLVVGWILYSLLFPADGTAIASQQIKFTIFPLGKPNLEYGIIIITFIGAIINMSNTFSSIQAAGRLFNRAPEQKQYNKSLFLTGIYSIVSSFFGLVPYAPFASAVGFLESTRIFHLKPFLYGGIVMSILGISPTLVGYLGTLPITVGNAVLFVAYLQLFGTALKSMERVKFDSKTIFRLAGPVLLGLSVMNLNNEAFMSFPVMIRPLLANGLIMGILLSIILELVINWDKISEQGNHAPYDNTRKATVQAKESTN